MLYHGIEIDPSRDDRIDEHGKSLMAQFYCMEGETIQMAFARASIAYSMHDEELAQRMYDYVSMGWLMFSSPILSNARLSHHEPSRGLPISCFLSYVPNTLEGLIEHSCELRWYSIHGGGVGGHWSDVQSVSDKSAGLIPFLRTCDSDIMAYRQGRTRKGSYAAYLDASHPEILDFITMRIAGGDLNRKCLNIHHGVNLCDAFMQAVEFDQPWNLIDPRSNRIVETVPARTIWNAILETRFRTGEPYIHFIDTSNRALPQTMQHKGLRINGSNLCSEIMLPTDSERSAVCCLSSLNIEYFDSWRDTTIVQDLTRFLDNVLSVFILHAPSNIAKARRSAILERSIGIGAMGFHAYLQKNMIPFESYQAIERNDEIFQLIYDRATSATYQLARERGCPEDMRGTGRRNAHLIAIAPNANSSIICGTSPSVEPTAANVYTARTRAGSFLQKNKALEEYLENTGYNTEETWNAILADRGSVQNLDFMVADAKAVFKTAIEIDQMTVIRLASNRQRFICQSQSINLFLPSQTERNMIHKIHFEAWKRGLKSLYYLRTQSSSVAEQISKCNRSEKSCRSCEG